MVRASRRWNRGAQVTVGFGLLITGWVALWTTTAYLNPLAFLLLWTGAALLMWSAAEDYPGVRRHLILAVISVPLWWYFEAINDRTGNWEYLGRDRYDEFEFAILASLAFATVVSALVAATSMVRWSESPSVGHDSMMSSRSWSNSSGGSARRASSGPRARSGVSGALTVPMSHPLRDLGEGVSV